MSESIGIIAGSGQFPRLVAEDAKAAGYGVVHDLITLTEKSLSYFFLFLGSVRRIQVSLQDLIQTFHTEKSFSHWCQNLDFKRFCFHIFGKFFLNQCNHYANDDIRIVSFEKKEIPALVIDFHLLTFIDLMCIHNNVTL